MCGAGLPWACGLQAEARVRWMAVCAFIHCMQHGFVIVAAWPRSVCAVRARPAAKVPAAAQALQRRPLLTPMAFMISAESQSFAIVIVMTPEMAACGAQGVSASAKRG